jgi:glycosyltransferase involved in cell wall biosynthesis
MHMKVVALAPFAFAPKATTAARTFPLAAALAERGHAITLLVPPYDNPSECEQEYLRDGVRVISVRSDAHSARNVLAVTARLVRAARALRPDVVHAFKPVGYAALAGMWLARTGGPPLVVDTDDWEGTGGWNDVNDYPALWRRFFDYQEHWLLTHARAVTVASRTLQTQAWGYGARPERVVYVPNCPTARFRDFQAPPADAVHAARARLDVPESAPLAMYAGFVNRNDVLDMAVRAIVAARRQTPGAMLAIVGDGTGLAAVRAEAERLGLSDMPAMLAAADVSVYPYRDTLINRSKCSIKILEYMAAGKAIVTHRVGQNVEYLEHMQSGWLCEPGDEAGFAEALGRLLADRELAARLGANAQARVREKFDWSRWVGVVEQAYAMAARDARG